MKNRFLNENNYISPRKIGGIPLWFAFMSMLKSFSVKEMEKQIIFDKS